MAYFRLHSFIVAISLSLYPMTLRCEEAMQLDLTSAISQALNGNRQLLGTLDQLTYSEYGVELAESEFNVQIVPNGRAGYVGGGHEGTDGRLEVGSM